MSKGRTDVTNSPALDHDDDHIAQIAALSPIHCFGSDGAMWSRDSFPLPLFSFEWRDQSVPFPFGASS